MKRHIFAAVIALLSTSCFAQPRQSLALQLKTDAVVVYYLDDHPQIEFDGQDMIVKIGETSERIPFDNIEKWIVGETDDSGLNQTGSNDATLSIDGCVLRICNPKEEPIRVYDIKGCLAGSSCGQTACFELPKGIYIVTIADKKHKIAII